LFNITANVNEILTTGKHYLHENEVMTSLIVEPCDARSCPQSNTTLNV